MSAETAFQALKSVWRRMIDHAIKDKQKFQDEADECMAFFDGPYDFLYGKGNSDDLLYKGKRKNLPKPSIAVTVNKIAEGVQIFGPTLYSKNPICKVNPRKEPMIPQEAFGNAQDPMVQQQVMGIMQQLGQQERIDIMRAALLSGYLNYLPEAINLKETSRDCIDEAIIKGAGVAWAVMDQLPAGKNMPAIEYDTIDNLFVDPDHESINHARWVARRFCKPVWEVEAERGLPKETLKGNYGSSSAEAADKAINRKEGKTNDLLVYWGIWSKMGLGGLLKGVSEDAAEMDRFGRYVYVEVCDGYEYFLNVPEEIWDNDEEIRRRVQWETPFWADTPTSNGWPFELFAFHKVPRKIWPMSHFKAGIGHLQFINWATSFLISGIQKRSRDFIAIAESSGEELKRALQSGDDLEMINMKTSLGESIDKVVNFLKHPEFNKDIMPIVQWQQHEFEKATGLNELMYGLQHKQDRSATESKIKENFINVRPEDMGVKVEETMSGCFRKMAMMSRWHQKGQEIAEVYGQVIGQLWDQYVATADMNELMHGLEYRIEAGSTKKPNRAKDQEDASNLMRDLFPMLSKYAMSTGNVDQANALLEIFGKANDLEVDKLKIPKPPPQPPPPPPGALEAQQHAQEMQQGAQQMQHDETVHQQGLRQDTEKHKVAMQIAREKAKAAKANTNGSSR